MSAPKGNQFWLARSTYGREKIFSTPEILWKAALEWFQWVEDNPLTEYKVSQYQGEAVGMELPKMRAMTVDGLCIFLDITRSTWYEYRSLDDYSDIAGRIENVMKNQKFTGASADLLNANIIARDLGLKDLSETTHKGSVGLTDLTSEKLDERIRELQHEYSQSAED